MARDCVAGIYTYVLWWGTRQFATTDATTAEQPAARDAYGVDCY
jgi:hypothetical protein